MKSALTLLTACVGALLLCACHSGAVQPHSYCHKLATKINSYDHAGTSNRINAAQRSTWAQEYKSLDCEDQ